MKDNNSLNDQQERLEAYRKALDEAMRVASDPSMDERTARMKERLDARIAADSGRKHRYWRMAGSYSAVACMLAAAVLIYHKQHVVLPQPSLTYENTEEYARRVTLPDGTSVCLKHGATLSFAEKDGTRQAGLSGEAYFDVARDTLRPFIVKTALLDVRVLGTAFSVSAPPGYSKADVILERGSVRLQTKGGASILRLSPNQKAEYDAATGDIAVEQVTAKPSIQQEYGMVSFENARVDEIIHAIESQYGIKINASGYSKTKQYHLSYFRSDNLGDVLVLLEALTGGHFSSNNSIH